MTTYRKYRRRNSTKNLYPGVTDQNQVQTWPIGFTITGPERMCTKCIENAKGKKLMKGGYYVYKKHVYVPHRTALRNVEGGEGRVVVWVKQTNPEYAAAEMALEEDFECPYECHSLVLL